MADQGLHTAIQCIRQIADPGRAAHLTDEVLLRQFIERRDEAAFAALVQRHGPLVLGVCQRVMHNLADSEDVFQATFLVLVRKARSIVKQRSIGSWLYGVAYRIAVRAKGARARRRAGEEQAQRTPASDALEEMVWRDLRPVLDEEVSRLPNKCRTPLILCYLEGRTTEEAADLLGCPRGTVLSRLARARVLLQTRLTRRGICLSGGAVATMLPQQATGAVVSGALAEATLHGAAQTAVVPGPMSAKVAHLLEGELHAMFIAKVRALGALLLSACLIVSGGVMLAQSSPTTDQAEAPHAAAQEGGKKEKAAAEPLKGNWTILSYERGGNKAPEQLIKTVKVVIQGDTFMITDGKDGEPATFKLDPAKKPKEIDLVFNEGPKKDIKRTALGIYELAGDGLKLAWRKDGAPRPTEFSSIKGERTSELLILKHEKPVEKDGSTAATVAEQPDNQPENAAQATTPKNSFGGAIGPLPIAWGEPKDGLRIAIAGQNPTAKGVPLPVTLENVGKNDFVVNLGMMLANGKKHLPEAIRLTLIGADKKTRVLKLRVPGIAGRVDPYVVPLPAGSRYTLTFRLDDFCDDESAASGAGIDPGRYRAKAEFIGKAVARDDKRDDLSAFALMHYWTGTVGSGELVVDVPAQK